MKEKLLQIKNSFITTVKPKLLVLDGKVNSLIPNPKTKKILYISLGSLFGFMFLIIVLGLILSPFKKQGRVPGSILNKPRIVATSPEPVVELSDIQKQILKLENDIKELKFPESILNIPQIERELSL